MSSKSIAILGRLPALSIAELESIHGYKPLNVISGHAVLIDKHHSEINFNRLGGTIKLAKLLYVFEHGDWNKVVDHLIKNMAGHLVSGSKISLGLSLYNLDIPPKKIIASALSIKKALKKDSFSIRVIPNTDHALSSAQVFHNKLTKGNNLELCFIKSGDRIYMAQTVTVQDIDAYSARDQMRPKRDSRVGMLPPKLAQTMVNLANPSDKDIVLDPFCGTGVILQEAILMGFGVYGTDLEQRMIDFTAQNLRWLITDFAKNMTITSSAITSNNEFALSVGDATETKWGDFDVVASEAYLGRPLSAIPDSSTLHKIVSVVDTILSKFLSNIVTQLKPNARVCLAVPTWKNHDQFTHLPLLDSLDKLGYNRVSFAHIDNKDLIYYRDDQVVGRELLVLTRK
jgi:tRNA (guanine10-N2)-dimethyltransferase